MKNIEGMGDMAKRWASAALKSAEAHWSEFPKLDRILGCHISRGAHGTTDPNPRSSKDEL